MYPSEPAKRGRLQQGCGMALKPARLRPPASKREFTPQTETIDGTTTIGRRGPSPFEKRLQREARERNAAFQRTATSDALGIADNQRSDRWERE